MGEPRRRSERVALVALAATVALAGAKVLVWAATGSLVVLSQALDSILDVFALALVFVGVRVARKPADESHHYGHAKAENLVAFTQVVLLGVVVAGVVVQALRRLAGAPFEVDTPSYALALLALSTLVDLARVRLMLTTARREGSAALAAGALNIATDVGTALVALASLVLVRIGVDGADAVGALLVAGAVALGSVRLGRRSVDVLMDRAPGARAAAIHDAAARASGVAETRRVRVRDSGSGLFADVTVAAGRTASLERAHDIAEDVEREISRVEPDVDVVVHVEPAPASADVLERVQAAASRADGVHEVHNVSVHSFEEEGRDKLHVTLHAKVDQTSSVEQAHELSDRIEEAIARELGGDVRVDTHIEPLTASAAGRDVTAERRDVVETVRKLALGEREVIDCHEVLVTEARGALSIVAHVRGRHDLPLARIHAASERIEQGVRENHRDVEAVLIHFEPASHL